MEPACKMYVLLMGHVVLSAFALTILLPNFVHGIISITRFQRRSSGTIRQHTGIGCAIQCAMVNGCSGYIQSRERCQLKMSTFSCGSSESCFILVWKMIHKSSSNENVAASSVYNTITDDLSNVEHSYDLSTSLTTPFEKLSTKKIPNTDADTTVYGAGTSIKGDGINS